MSRRRAPFVVAALAVVVYLLAVWAPRAAAAVPAPPQLQAALAALAPDVPGARLDCMTAGELDPFEPALAAGVAPIYGYTFLGTHRVVLSALACGELILLAVDPADRRGSTLNGPLTTAYAGYALLDLAHEAGHLERGPNEGGADCYALERERDAAVNLFGVPPTRAAALAAYGRHLHEQAAPIYREGCP